MWRRLALTTALWLLVGLWLAHAPRPAEAGNGWIFRPSYQDYTPPVDVQKARRMAFRQRLLYGRQASGYAIHLFRHSTIYLGGGHHGGDFGSGHAFSGTTRYHIHEHIFSVPAPF